MANEEHLKILKSGVVEWNAWREETPDVRPDLHGADLRQVELHKAFLRNAFLREANLSGVDLSEANLGGADLIRSNLRNADVSEAFLAGARLMGVDLSESSLSGANLSGARLVGSNLNHSKLDGAQLVGGDLYRVKPNGADFHQVLLNHTIFADVDLTETKGLDSCRHAGPSIVDHRTLQKSKNVPVDFWRGCGLPDDLSDYMPSLVNDAIQFYSCFISYSSKDQGFADCLHADLQNNGVRCWFAPHDLPIGKKILDGLDEAIRMRDRVVLILSEDAINSDWVEDEVSTAFEEERRRKETMLFPIRLDDAVMETDEAWASKLRARNIGDFTRWKDHDAYKRALDRVLRDLKVERPSS
ncbi:MAG: toll/interleukin-1 receptor domain-containing protein [Pseudomonadota bacterium]